MATSDGKYVQGGDEIEAALRDLADFGLREWKATLRAATREPMKKVAAAARANIAAFSPGKAATHRTYKGNWVMAGFASRSILLSTRITKQGSTTVVGVLKEAFYALSFFEIGVPSRGIARQPWLVPALEASKSTVIRDVGSAMKKRMDALWNRRVLKAAAAARKA